MPLFTMTGAERTTVTLGADPGTTYTLRWTSADGLPLPHLAEVRTFDRTARKGRLTGIKLVVSTTSLAPGQPVRADLTAWASFNRRGQRSMVEDTARLPLSYRDLAALVNTLGPSPMITLEPPSVEARQVWGEASRLFTELHGSPPLADLMRQAGVLPLEVFAAGQRDQDAWALVRRMVISAVTLGRAGRALALADARTHVDEDQPTVTPWAVTAEVAG